MMSPEEDEESEIQGGSEGATERGGGGGAESRMLGGVALPLAHSTPHYAVLHPPRNHQPICHELKPIMVSHIDNETQNTFFRCILKIGSGALSEVN